VAIDHDGSVFACDHYVYPEYRLGDVLHDELGAMVERSVASGFGPHKESTLPRYCQQCEVKQACWAAAPSTASPPRPRVDPASITSDRAIKSSSATSANTCAR
jgi:radical SAM protein with 4Fe4S-binding SPASM domain